MRGEIALGLVAARRRRTAITGPLRRTDGHVTLASGPWSSRRRTRRARYRKPFTTPGEYRISCSLHPVTMALTIEVR